VIVPFLILSHVMVPAAMSHVMVPAAMSHVMVPAAMSLAVIAFRRIKSYGPRTYW
jgi:hypothetical protein